ncbi:MAG TPA: REJ domain-containing protein, partial [Chitinophagaceae bacterium]|nr:REJ domain-containing protein [Chitinophagaceae bacterium]
DGSGSSDPGGTITSYSWSNLSGPYGYSLTGAATSKASLGNLSAGVYEFELTVTDNFGLSAMDTVLVTVITALDIPPVAVTGPNITLTLPLDSTQLDGSSSYDPDGTVASYTWTQVSGPTGFLISGASSAKAHLGGLTVGAYIFRLTVTDNSGASSFARVTVTVSNHVPPVSNAGSNINITLPVNTASLDGTGSFDSDGTITTYGWTEVSGPSTYTLTGAGSARAQLTNLGAGTYVFRLTVTDNAGSSASSTVTLTVSSAPPVATVADAGPGTTLTLPANSAMLDGSGSRASGGRIVSYRWTEISGPASYQISNPDSSLTGITGLVAGTYVFGLTVTDDAGASASAQVTVTVIPAPVHPPVSYAGPNMEITLPSDTATLDGSGSYDQSGTLISYTWTEVSGPSTYTLVGSNLEVATLSGLVTGTYVFELTVKDNNGASATSEVTITVNPAPNIPPVSIAGKDTTITLPSDTVKLDGSASYAVDGKITAYQWKEVAGPFTYIMGDSTTSKTLVTGLVAGSYLFSLTVTDANGLQSTSQVEVTVNLNANVTNGQVVVYPNPAVNSATVYFYNNQDGKIGVNLYDLWGRLKHSYSFIKDHQAIFKEKLDLTDLPPGMYFVQVSINGTFSTSVKLEKLSN